MEAASKSTAYSPTLRVQENNLHQIHIKDQADHSEPRPIKRKDHTLQRSNMVQSKPSLRLEKPAHHKAALLRVMSADAHVLRDTHTIVLYGITISFIKELQKNWAAISHIPMTQSSFLKLLTRDSIFGTSQNM